MVIFYLVLKSISNLKKDYYFDQAGYYCLGTRGVYPVYSVASKSDKLIMGDFMQIAETRP